MIIAEVADEDKMSGFGDYGESSDDDDDDDSSYGPEGEETAKVAASDGQADD